MKEKVTIQPNPSKQKRDCKILEISFTDTKGNYRGCLIALKIFNNIPAINIYRIDEGININVSKEREKPQ